MNWAVSTATNTAREIGLKTLANFARTWEAHAKQGEPLRKAIAEALHLAGEDASAKEVLIYVPKPLRRGVRWTQQIMKEIREINKRSLVEAARKSQVASNQVMKQPTLPTRTIRTPPRDPVQQAPVDPFLGYRDPEVKDHPIFEPEQC